MNKINIILTMLLLFSIKLFPEKTKSVKTITGTDLEKGFTKGLSYSDEGILQLKLGCRELYTIDSLVIWSLCNTKDNNLFVGTGHSGKVYIFSANSQEPQIIETSTQEIYAIKENSKGEIFFGTGPKGILLKYNKAEQKSEIFTMIAEEHIWDIAFDSENNLYIACGAPGKIYKISDKSQKLIYTSTEEHILKLKILNDNSILAATSGQGYLIHIDSSGAENILFDADSKDISSFVVINNESYVFATSGKKLISQNKKSYYKNELYLIDKESNFEKLFELQNQTILSLFYDGINIYIGTGENGSLFAYNLSDRQIERIFNIEEAQITSFASYKNNKILFSTGTSAKIFELSPVYNKKGEYISDIFDTHGLSLWGRITATTEIPENTSVHFYTRSGNTYSPNFYWDDWKKTDDLSQIKSKKARFIQYKIQMESANQEATPKLYNINLYYKKINQAPQISSITFGRDPSVIKDNKLKLSDNQYILAWNSIDPDNDILSYKVLYKNNLINKWILLDENMTDNFIIIDKFKFPQAKYSFKIIASDLKVNTIDTFIETAKESKICIIDNSPAEIKITEYKEGILLFSIIDSISIIKRILVSYNQKDFFQIDPIDGVYDNLIENFSIQIPDNTYFIHIKAIDNSGNMVFNSIDLGTITK